MLNIDFDDSVVHGDRFAPSLERLKDEIVLLIFFFQAEDGIRDIGVTGVQTCALPILSSAPFDFDGNCARIIASAKEAKSKGAELTVFSEMCLLGYPARDLLEKPAFLDARSEERRVGKDCKYRGSRYH